MLILDMEEIDASLNFFSGRIIAIVNADAKPKEEEAEAVKSNN